MGNKNNINLIYDKKKQKIVKQKSGSKKKLVNEDDVDIDNTVVLTQKERNKKRYEARKQRYGQEKRKLQVEPENEKIEKEQIDNKEKEVKKEEKKKEKKVKERKKIFVLESDIPLEDDKENHRIRVKRYLTESLVFALLLTIINLLASLVFDFVNMLNLFDVQILNILITMVLSFIVSYAMSFFVDCLLTEIWIKIKVKKEGEVNGDSRFIKRKNRENIKN